MTCDFVSNSFADSCRLRVLAVFEGYTRQCLALVDGTAVGLAIRTWTGAVIDRCGSTNTIVCDNRTELTWMAALRCCQRTIVE